MKTKPDWAEVVANSCYEYVYSQDGGMSEPALKVMADRIRDSAWGFIMQELSKIPGGYNYSGACSNQICFPLKQGGELRFSHVDDDCAEGVPYSIDLYGGELPPCIIDFSKLTGQSI